MSMLPENVQATPEARQHLPYVGDVTVLPQSEQQPSLFERARLFVAAGALTAVLVACSSAGGEDSSDTSPTTAETTATTDDESSPTTELQIPGGFADGSDEAVRADNQRGMFECGPREDDVAGSNEYDPDNYINYMSEHPDLTDALNEFNKNDMGAAAYEFIIEKAAVNPLADAEVAGNEQYSALAQKLVATRDIPEGTLSLNHSCIDEIAPYDVRTLHNGESTMLGLVLTQEDYQEWAELVEKEGLDPEYFISFDMNINVDDEKNMGVQFVVLYHGVCKNPQRTVPPEIVPPTTQPPEVTTTTGDVPTTPPETTPDTTPTTPPSSTPETTTTVEDKEPEPTPGPGDPGTTIAPPAGPPGGSPTTVTTRPPETSTTTVATVPETTPPTVTITTPQG